MVGVVSWDLEKSQASLNEEHKAVAMQNREVHELARRTIKEHEDHPGFDTTVGVVDRVPELMKKTRNSLAKINTEVEDRTSIIFSKGRIHTSDRSRSPVDYLDTIFDVVIMLCWSLIMQIPPGKNVCKSCVKQIPPGKQTYNLLWIVQVVSIRNLPAPKFPDQEMGDLICPMRGHIVLIGYTDHLH